MVSARKDRKVKMSYISYDLALQKSRNDGWKDGWKDGSEHHLIKLICAKLKKGKLNSQIAEELEESIEIIDFITTVAKKYAPDYDVEKIMEELHKQELAQTI